MSAGDVAVYARFLVVRALPMVVLDVVTDADDAPALLQPTLFRALVDHGLAVLPGFYGCELPRGARVGFTLEADELRLEDEDATGLLRVGRANLPPAWVDAALRLKGTMTYAGRDLDMDPDLSARDLCDLLDLAARDERVAGAIVGVAEPRQDLPLLGLG